MFSRYEDKGLILNTLHVVEKCKKKKSDSGQVRGRSYFYAESDRNEISFFPGLCQERMQEVRIFFL